MDQVDKKVTIIVLTYNNEDTIFRCLRSIEQQSISSEKYNTIVLDNGSNDNTLDIIRSFKFDYYVFPNLNIAALRNQGVELAKTPIVGFVDSDCEICRDWVINGSKWFGDKRIAVVGCKYSLPANASFLERNWICEPIDKVTTNTLIPAGNMFVSKDVFNIIGGFDEKLVTSEDACLLQTAREKGYLTISDPGIKSIHYGNPKTIKELFKKEIWYGLGGGSIQQRIESIDKPFILSNIVLIILIIMLYGIFSFNYLIIMLSILVFIAISLLSAIDRRFVKMIKGKFFYIVFVYFVYLLARTYCLIYIYKIKKYNRQAK